MKDFQQRMAAACNNRTWDLWEIDSPTAAEREQMIHAAHAAFLHWDAVGKPINRLRAWVTLAYAHLRAGSIDLAEEYLEKGESLLKEQPEGLQDWDEPFLVDARSRLHEARGEVDLAEEARGRAEQKGNAIAGEGDREYFLRTMGQHRGAIETR